MQNSFQVLWADDEIDLLKPHVIFLENKGYSVTTANNGADALDLVKEHHFDLVFLDENMPGLTGLETLSRIKMIKPNLPVVMITKSEEENIMEGAIGQKIADYLIKPVNPNQILLSLKKNLEQTRLVSDTAVKGYQMDFRNIAMQYNDRLGFEEWIDIYKRLIHWELEIAASEDRSMTDVLTMQKEEANSTFASFIEDNYPDWISDPKAEKPLMSHQLMRRKVFSHVGKGKPVYFVLIDNLRWDQWKAIQAKVEALFTIEEESAYYSILPTTTAYARNAIFAGMLPKDITKQFPKLWVEDSDDEGKNNHEEELLTNQLSRSQMGQFKTSYHKIVNNQAGKDLVDKLHLLKAKDLNVIVYNFVDMLSHARTDAEMIRELAPDEAAYRSLTQSWFEHSPLLEMLEIIARQDAKVVITTDHGTIRVKKPFRIVGDKNVNSNLRYKQGKNLGYDKSNDIMEVRKPDSMGLPSQNISTSFVFAKGDQFFAYPNNYNYYVNYFRNTFQHGGISLEEMIIPCLTLSPKL